MRYLIFWRALTLLFIVFYLSTPILPGSVFNFRTDKKSDLFVFLLRKLSLVIYQLLYLLFCATLLLQTSHLFLCKVLVCAGCGSWQLPVRAIVYLNLIKSLSGSYLFPGQCLQKVLLEFQQLYCENNLKKDQAGFPGWWLYNLHPPIQGFWYILG